MCMRTERRARILELAANEGKKGFSGVVAEALDLHLADQKDREKASREALALKGSMSEADAAGLLAETRKIRANWR